MLASEKIDTETNIVENEFDSDDGRDAAFTVEGLIVGKSDVDVVGIVVGVELLGGTQPQTACTPNTSGD